MLPYRDGKVARIVFTLFFALVILYAYYEVRGLLFGPRIDMGVPEQVTVVHDRYITIQGQAERIAQLTMNGNPVAVTEDGAFEEPYLLKDGYNRIVLQAKDRYGRTSESVVEVIYEPPTAGATVPSSSTSTSSVSQ